MNSVTARPTSVVSQAEEFKEVLNNETLLIVGDQINYGLGDLACAMRVADLFCRFGKIPEKQITISSNQPDLMKKVFCKDGRFRILHTDEAAQLEGVRLAVVAPFDGTHSGLETACRGYPVLFLTEYNYSKQGVPIPLQNSGEAYVMGLRSTSNPTIGILIDEELKSWSQSDDALDLSKRIQLLTLLPESIQQCILSNRSAANFAETTSLFVGYASKQGNKNCFLAALSRVEEASTKDLFVVLPGPSLDWQLGKQRLPTWMELQLKYHGVGEIHSMAFCEDKIDDQGTIRLSDNKKRLTILTGTFFQDQLKILWKASERDVMATGDQSLGEALAANKAIVYEEGLHKSEVAKALADSYSLPQGTQVSFAADNDVDNGRTSAMAQSILNRRLNNYEATDKGNQMILRDWDANPKIIQLATGLIKRVSPFPRPEDFTKVPLTEFNAAALPFDRLALVMGKHLSGMRAHWDGYSELPELADSLISSGIISNENGNSIYVIQRKRVTEKL